MISLIHLDIYGVSIENLGKNIKDVIVKELVASYYTEFCENCIVHLLLETGTSKPNSGGLVFSNFLSMEQ